MNPKVIEFVKARDFCLLNLPDWKTQNAWEVKNKGVIGLFMVLSAYFDLKGIGEQTFRNTLRKDPKDEMDPKATTILRCMNEMISSNGYIYDSYQEDHVPDISFSAFPDTLSSEERLATLDKAKGRMVISNSFIEQVSLYCGRITQKFEQFPGIITEIFLPHPEGIFAKSRNLYPHPESATLIPQRIEENTTRFKELWKDLGEPNNFRLWWWHKDMLLPFCLYGCDREYHWAPYYPHMWAAHSPFHVTNGNAPQTLVIEKMLHHLREYGNRIF